jgi:hypothetical protein
MHFFTPTFERHQEPEMVPTESINSTVVKRGLKCKRAPLKVAGQIGLPLIMKVATTPFSIPVQVLINASKVLEGSENKKETISSLLSIMAPLNDESCNYKELFFSNFFNIR